MAPKSVVGELSMVDLNKSDAFDRASTFLQKIKSSPNYDCHDKILGQALELKSAKVSPDDPKVASTVYSLTALPELCNSTGNLHGGAVALIFDICTSMTIAPAASKGFWDTGNVSRTLNCTYLRPVPKGSKCTVESEVVHLGKSAGMVRGVIKDANRRTCYTCEHGKVAVDFSSGKYKL